MNLGLVYVCKESRVSKEGCALRSKHRSVFLYSRTAAFSPHRQDEGYGVVRDERENGITGMYSASTVVVRDFC